MQIAHYRPISVLKIFSKIIEKHAFKHLYIYLEANNVLTDCQIGFRYKRSTTQAIVQHHIHYTGVKLWNVIPPEIKAKQTIVSFIRNLKIYFYEQISGGPDVECILV